MKTDTTETKTSTETTKSAIRAEPTIIQQPRHRSNAGKYIAAAIVLIFLCFTAGLGGAWIMTNGFKLPVSLTTHSGTDGNKIVTEQEQDIASVASKVSPSVVSIVTKGEARSYYGGTQTQEGAGTGIIVSSSGYIMTNKHVIQGSQSVTVVTSDGVSHSNVKVLGADPLNDLAFLKIDGVSNLKAAELGDSSSLRIGQSVVAIGNALGQYQNSVTSGIISGTGRSVTAALNESDPSSDTETLTDLVQTDAAINPGNSGGPLVNIAGQVIGINTAIASDANGVGFTIPVNAAKGLLKGVLANGKVERAYVGVNYVTITADVADAYKLPVRSGAYVYAEGGRSPIVDGSPAAKAGIKNKDIITKVNDIDVGDKGSVASLVAEYAPGDTVRLTILRDDKKITVDVVLAPYAS
jgi:serine protease Do